MEIKEIRRSGVVVKSDYGLYTEDSGIVLLSIYGAPQQVQAVSAAVVGGKPVINYSDCVRLTRLSNANFTMRMRGRSIGYGKRHVLLWSDEAVERSIIWMKDADRDSSVEAFMSQRKVPCEREYFPLFQERLIAEGTMEALYGWGDIHGLTLFEDNDDRLCDLMLDIVASSPSEDNIPLERGVKVNEVTDYGVENHA